MAIETYHHGNLKESLIAEAEKLIEAGQSNISLRQLAKKAGVSHTAPYRHFKSWDDLQVHIRLRFLNQMLFSLQKIAIGERSSALKIQDFAKQLIEVSIQKPQKFLYLSYCPQSSHSGSDELTEAPNQEIFKVLVKLCIQHLHEVECRKKADPFSLASTLWTSFFGIAHLAHSGWIPFDKKSIYGEKLLQESLKTLLPQSKTIVTKGN